MSINFFEVIFNDTVLNFDGDTQVCCPFPHKAGNLDYFETRPSAGVNLSKNVFHCFSCGRSYSETSFAAEILKTSYENASKFLSVLHTAEHLDTWKYAEKNIENVSIQKLIDKLQITPKVIKELHIGYTGSGGGEEITIPVVLFDYILDKVTYRPGQHPKYIRKTKSISGLPCPYDLWKQSPKDRPTLVCAGEKDMLIARSKGFNAISFTGGENNVPTMFLNEFTDRDVFIIYDNDETGHMGSKKLALAIRKYAKSVHVVDISSVCKEKGQDLWDFFCVYNREKEDLIEIMTSTPEFTEEEFQKIKNEIYPIIPLADAMQPKNLNKVLKSNIQIIATIDSVYTAPTIITGQKLKNDDDEKEPLMRQGDERNWCLNETNYKELFYMIDSNLKEKAIEKYIKTDLLRIPEKEKHILIKKDAKIPIFKCVVTDTVESYSSDASVEFVAFSLNKKLENGKKYIATYKLVPHPQDGQRIIMVIKDVEESDDFLTSFKVTDDIIASLKKFQPSPGQLASEKLNELIELSKGIVNADYDEILLKVVDIWYHSVLQFSVGRMRDLRGYIDGIIVGESRIGKSSTVAAFQKMYEVGKIVSLAGSSATPAGLIGGSNKMAGGAYQTRAGVIPQNNRGAIIFEELIKCKTDLIKELTDIRSSNKVRIARVNGSIELPAYVRMLTLTNSKTHDGVPKPINSYPNGISLLTDIIGTPEDIARYDMIAIFGFEATKEIDPFYTPPEPLPKIDYQNRIRWVWSRTQEQVYITQTVYQYAVKQANELNRQYGSFINIFGVEAWQKIMRIGIAIAGYLCSTDETFEQIIVTEEHIDEAIKLLLELYDNSTFKLKEYVEEEKKCNTITQEDRDVLEEIWKISSILLDYLFKNPQTTKVNLQMVSGLENDRFNRVIYKLAKQNLIRIDKSFIFTTNKYTKGFNEMDRSVVIQREVVFRLED
jgi:hypothetical protein